MHNAYKVHLLIKLLFVCFYLMNTFNETKRKINFRESHHCFKIHLNLNRFFQLIKRNLNYQTCLDNKKKIIKHTRLNSLIKKDLKLKIKSKQIKNPFISQT